MIDFNNKNVLAPMVRVTNLPMRLLSLRFGADYVYSEETIDHKILNSVRVKNDILDTIDYVMGDGTIVFRTCEEEKGKVIFQMGSNNAERALKVGKLIQQDVAAIDLNMGCPKPFSVKGGMGAEMLKDPDNSCKILKLLSDNLTIPVTCKIRILPNNEKTTELVTKLSETGISAMAVHGRYPNDRPRFPVHDNIIKMISELIGNKITIIANGGSVDYIKKYEDIDYFKRLCDVSSAMIGQAAMWNPSIFKDTSNDNYEYSYRDIIDQYLKLAVRYDNNITSIKYCIAQFLHENTKCPEFSQTASAKDVKEICEIWLLSKFYESEIERRNLMINKKEDTYETPIKRQKLCINENDKQIVGKCKFYKSNYGKTGWSPKFELLAYCKEQKWNIPKFTIKQNQDTKLFYCSILLNEVLYKNEIGNKGKLHAEQAISSICLKSLGRISKTFIDNEIVVE